MKYSMFEILRWGEPEIWINMWVKNYSEKRHFYRYFLWILVWPFLQKFWFNPNDKCWDENYLVFQNVLFNCTNYNKFWEYLSKNWYEILEVFKEYWDNFDIKNYLEKVKKWNMFFWFLPWDWKNPVIVFAKRLPIEIEFISSGKVRQTVESIEECLAWIDLPNLPPEIKNISL